MQSLGVKNKDFNDFSITEAHLPTELKNNHNMYYFPEMTVFFPPPNSLWQPK